MVLMMRPTVSIASNNLIRTLCTERRHKLADGDLDFCFSKPSRDPSAIDFALPRDD
jgi:hypothetical protein